VYGVNIGRYWEKGIWLTKNMKYFFGSGVLVWMGVDGIHDLADFI